MSISSRIHDTIENWQAEWKDRLRGWLATSVMDSMIKSFDFLEPDVRAELKPSLQRLKDIPNLPPDIKNILEKAMIEPSAIQLAFLLPMAIGLLLGAGMGIAAPLMRVGGYQVDQFVRSARLDPLLATRALFRGFITKEYFTKVSKDLGWSDEDIETIINVSYYYPSPLELVNWQAKEVFEPEMRVKYGLMAELEELEREAFYKAGMTDEQIDNFWMAHWQHPAFREVTEMLHRGELTPADVYSWYRLVEIPPYWRDKLTKISWDLPNRIELRMMARYGLVDKSFLLEQLKQVGLQEEFRDIAADMMLAMGIRTDLSTRYSKGWITADEVRQELIDSGLSETVQTRMYEWIVKNTQTDRVTKERDLTVTDIIKGVKKGTISRIEGQSLIEAMGYDEKEAKFKLDINIPIEEQVQEVKQRELTKADITKAYKLGTIDYSESLSKLIGIRFTEDDAHFLLALVDITKEPIEDIRQRELTKIDIVKGVKAGVIDSYEGYMMLQDIGYTPADSQFILEVRVEAAVGSPDTYREFDRITQDYRASIGLSSKPVSLELIQAERDVKAAEAALADGRARKVKPKRLLELEGVAETAKIAYHQLLQEHTKET